MRHSRSVRASFGMAMKVFVICGAHSFSIPPRNFSRHFVLRLPMVAMICENSINSSNDGVDDSQHLIGVNSFDSDDQINTGAGHDISHNKDKRPSVEDDKSSSSDQSSNDSDSDNYDVGATPPRGKNATSLLNLQQRILPTAKNRGRKYTPNLHLNTNTQVNLILTMMMLGLNLPEVKRKESVESTIKNCTYCAEFRRQNPQRPTPIQIPLCIPDISLPPLSKRLAYSESNYRGDHIILPSPATPKQLLNPYCIPR
jgi:hypothetical protein